MPSLLLALSLAAWPLPRDAGLAEYAAATNWPDEPGWLADWPLLSFTPPGLDGGAGLRVDVAWSITQGRPTSTIAVIGPAHALADPRLVRLRLNGGELPGVADVNGDGVLDLLDLTGDPRVPDVNDNAALDLDDVLAAFSNGVDDDGNGLADDLCGWDFTRNAQPRHNRDAGSELLARLVAPVGDGRPGIGVCPGCTVLPVVTPAAHLAPAVELAFAAGARIVVLLPERDALPLELFGVLGRHPDVVFITPAGPGPAAPLELHPALLVPRALDEHGVARACGSQRARLGVSAPACGVDAALLLAGVAGLVRSIAPSTSPGQLAGLLSGSPLDAARAVSLAEQTLPDGAATPSPLEPRWTLPASGAESCEVRTGGSVTVVDCDGGGPLRAVSDTPFLQAPWGQVVDLSETIGPLQSTTPLLAVPPDFTRGLAGVTHLGWGAEAPRLVHIDADQDDAALVMSPEGLAGLTSRVRVETVVPVPAGQPLMPAYGDLLDDRQLDVVTLSRDGQLDAWAIAGVRLDGFPVSLGGPAAGPPVLAPGPGGSSLVTARQDGLIEVRRGSIVEWSTRLDGGVRGPLATGDVDGDGALDVAIVADDGLHLLFGALHAPRSSWRRETRAVYALLGDLSGSGRLDIVVDRVFSWTGDERVTLEGWTPPLSPPALARLDSGPLRSLVQVEAGPGNEVLLCRYDVERAVRARGNVARRVVMASLPHLPAPGGLAVADLSGDGRPDVILPTQDGLLFAFDGQGKVLADFPRATLGSVEASPAVGVFDGELTVAVRTTRGDLVRYAGVGFPRHIGWEGAGHDRGNTNNAQTPLPVRSVGGLGITEPPRLAPPGCGCTAGGSALLWLSFALGVRARRKAASRAARHGSHSPP
jgi:hypothetical protein